MYGLVIALATRFVSQGCYIGMANKWSFEHIVSGCMMEHNMEKHEGLWNSTMG